MNNTNKWLVGVIAILVILLGYQTFRTSSPADNTGAAILSTETEDADLQNLDKTLLGGDFETPTTDKETSKQTTINIPIFKTDQTPGGELVGCGSRMVFINKSIPYTKSVLDATYKELFSMYPELNFAGTSYENPVGRETDHLRFDRVTLSNGTANVYLEGSIMTAHCGIPTLEAQLKRTATYYPNVQIVNIYLNNKLFDFSKFGDERG